MDLSEWLSAVGSNGAGYSAGAVASELGPGHPSTITSADSPQGVEKTDSGLAYLSNSSDSWVNAYNQEQAWARDDLIRREGYAREDTAYQRLFEDLKKAGVNPAVLLGSAESLTGSSGQSASTFKTSNYDSNAKLESTNSAKVFAAIISAIGLFAAALL